MRQVSIYDRTVKIMATEKGINNLNWWGNINISTKQHTRPNEVPISLWDTLTNTHTLPLAHPLANHIHVTMSSKAQRGIPALAQNLSTAKKLRSFPSNFSLCFSFLLPYLPGCTHLQVNCHPKTLAKYVYGGVKKASENTLCSPTFCAFPFLTMEIVFPNMFCSCFSGSSGAWAVYDDVGLVKIPPHSKMIPSCSVKYVRALGASIAHSIWILACTWYTFALLGSSWVPSWHAAGMELRKAWVCLSFSVCMLLHFLTFTEATPYGVREVCAKIIPKY